MALDDKVNTKNIDFRRYSPTRFTVKCNVGSEVNLSECAEKNKNMKNMQLESLKEDLADWLNKTLGTTTITGDNFLYELDNGVILCHLAQIICKTAEYTSLQNQTVPKIPKKCFENAKRRSFFSRDNMENFIKFCRSLGVHENLLFESDDLVLHNNPRNVILCLLEVARIASLFGVEPPSLIHLRTLIASEEHPRSPDPDIQSILLWKFKSEPNTFGKNFSNLRSSPTNLWNSSTAVTLHPITRNYSDTNSSSPVPPAGSDGIPSDHTDDCSQVDDLVGTDDSQNNMDEVITELDKKILQVSRIIQKNCACDIANCPKLKIRKISEGKYNIAGKVVFVRLLKGNRMMVRVGGGWESLDRFLLRHDPCRTKDHAQRIKKVISKPPPITKLPITFQQPPKITTNRNDIMSKFTYYKKFCAPLPIRETSV